MKQAETTTKHHSFTVARLGCMVGLLLTFTLLLTSPAQASYEQVATFGNSRVGGELNGVVGMAVNISGAGGVPAGTVYAINEKGARVLRYSAKGEFREAWGWGIAFPKERQANHPTNFSAAARTAKRRTQRVTTAI